MEKHSEQKQEGWDVTSTSTANEWLLKQCVAELSGQSLTKYTDAQTEELQAENDATVEECDNIKCSKCHSSDIEKRWVSGQHLLHCICNQCEYEWVE